MFPQHSAAPSLPDYRDEELVSPGPLQTKRGYLNPTRVMVFSFWTTALCILVAVVASILAIWKFTGTDALWRTVATCVVIGIGTVAFSFVNSLFGAEQ
jgi:uncharacterized membrane protein YwaF